MRSVFLQNSKNLPNNITEQIKELNELVIEEIVPKLLGEIEGYLVYRKDISEIPETSLFAPSNGKLGYMGEHEVLTYDTQVHKINVSDSNYIIYDTISHKVFKIYFDDTQLNRQLCF